MLLAGAIFEGGVMLERPFSWQAQRRRVQNMERQHAGAILGDGCVMLERHFSGQAQYLVQLERHFSWQAHYLLKFGYVRGVIFRVW